jgi:nucleoside phosphorylase
MIFIITALAIEAVPIIEHFKLKTDRNVHTYNIYRNAEIALIVAGVGKVKSAMASVY